MCDREGKDKSYKWEIVYKKENTSPVDMKQKNGFVRRNKGVCMETRTRKK